MTGSCLIFAKKEINWQPTLNVKSLWHWKISWCTKSTKWHVCPLMSHLQSYHSHCRALFGVNFRQELLQADNKDFDQAARMCKLIWEFAVDFCRFCCTVTQTIELQHDKTNKMTYAPSEDSGQPGHLPSLISLGCPPEETLGPYLTIKCTAKILTRLGGCPGWSELSLGARHFVDFVVLWLKCKKKMSEKEKTSH